MTGIILLAAGSSSRLGRPKQLVDWRGRPLVRHMASVAVEASLGTVTVVLGANDGRCREALEGLPVSIIHHSGWASGMGGSIAAGMLSLVVESTRGVIVMPCDQPFVDTGLLRSLDALSEGKRIVGCRYGGQQGPPVFFPPEHYNRLLALDGEGGAKSVIRDAEDVMWIDAPEAGVDIDTPEDLQALG